MTDSLLSPRQVAALQQMGVTPYRRVQPLAELALVTDAEDPLAHPLVRDVLRYLAIEPAQCVVVTSADEARAKRRWHLDQYRVATATELRSLPLSELCGSVEAKRRLWQGLQRWQ
ncbi:DNA polymerase III subunit psi [Ferrimonas gelatinilytica]